MKQKYIELSFLLAFVLIILAILIKNGLKDSLPTKTPAPNTTHSLLDSDYPSISAYTPITSPTFVPQYVIGNVSDSSSVVNGRCPGDSFVKTIHAQQKNILLTNPVPPTALSNMYQPNISFFRIVCSDPENTSFSIGSNLQDSATRNITFNEGWSRIKAKPGRTTILNSENIRTEMGAIRGFYGYQNTNSTSSALMIGGDNAGTENFITCDNKIKGFELGTKNDLLTHIGVYCE